MASNLWHDNTGFYNAPVCEGLVGYMVITCIAFNVAPFAPFTASLKKYLICKFPEVFYKGEYWRILTSKLSFIHTQDLVLGALLIFIFRIFERRYGSHKFASFITCSQAISVVLEVTSILTLQWLGFDFHEGGNLPPGPYGILFSLFVNYHNDIPHMMRASIGGMMTYVFGLSLCYTSTATAISAGCGIVAGIVCRYNLLGICRLPWVPKWLAKGVDRTLGRLLARPPPAQGPVGATLELQRQEQFEVWEQQMMVQRARELRNRPMVNNDASPFLQGAVGDRRGQNQGLNEAPTEDQIQTLVEMGFERERVVRALQTSQNDVNAATHLLLLQHT